MEILVVTLNPLPLPGLNATGAGIRAWGLAEGLKAAGLQARAVMPAGNLLGRFDAGSEPYRQHVYPDSALPDFIARSGAAAVVAQHWGVMRALEGCETPIALDLAGPHLLERRLWGHEDLSGDIAEKLAALRRADYVTCSGRRQRQYFLGWLAQAGFDLADANLCPSIPLSWIPEGPPARAFAPGGGGGEPLFVAGGVLLPWQNPGPAIEALLGAMDEVGGGRLVYLAGGDSRLNCAGGESLALFDLLERHPRAECRGLVPFDQLLALFQSADAAFDVLPSNNERELAFPIRTSIYLWAGLPVVHGDHDEPAELIGRYGAGWTVDAGDAAAVRKVAREILRDPALLSERADAARRLAEAELDWTRNVTPLAAFCRAPKRRMLARAPAGMAGADAGSDSMQAARATSGEDDSMRLIALQRDLDEARREIAAVRGKWPFRLARRLRPLAWIAAPVVYVAVFAITGVAAVAALIGDRFLARGK